MPKMQNSKTIRIQYLLLPKMMTLMWLNFVKPQNPMSRNHSKTMVVLEGHTNFYIPFPFFKKGVMVEYPLNMSKLVTFTDFEYKDIVIFRPMNMTAQNSKDIFD